MAGKFKVDHRIDVTCWKMFKSDLKIEILKIFRLGMDVQSSEMMATDLQDLSTQASPDATNPDVLAAANTVSHEEAANAVSIDPESNFERCLQCCSLQLVTEKEVNNPDVQRQLDSSGYLGVGTGGNEVSDSNSPESNTQSFLSYLQDHANTGTSVVTGKKIRNLPIFQIFSS